MNTYIVYLIMILVSAGAYFCFNYLRKKNIITSEQTKIIVNTLNISESLISSIDAKDALIIIPILDIIELALESINDKNKEQQIVQTTVDNIALMAKDKGIQIDDSIKGILNRIVSECLNK